MVFESLYASSRKGELVLLEGGMCRFHLRRDRQVTIHEIIVEQDRQRQGIGRRLLAEVRQRAPQAISILAKCPADLASNTWYSHVGFRYERQEETPNGRLLNVWVFPCA